MTAYHRNREIDYAYGTVLQEELPSFCLTTVFLSELFDFMFCCVINEAATVFHLILRTGSLVMLTKLWC